MAKKRSLILLSALAFVACQKPRPHAAKATVGTGLVNGVSDSIARSFGVIVYHYENGSTQDYSLCTGTVVAPRLILTASHCFASATSASTFVVGGSVVSPWVGEAEVVAVARLDQWILHPRFDPKIAGSPYDIALARADRDLSTTFIPVSLAWASWKPENGDKYVLVGAGSQSLTPSRDTAPSEIRSGLYNGPLKVVRPEGFKIKGKGKSKEGPVVDDAISPGALYELGVSDLNTQSFICSGDSGGALIAKRGETITQIGVLVAAQTVRIHDIKSCTGRNMKVVPVGAHEAWIRDSATLLLGN